MGMTLKFGPLWLLGIIFIVLKLTKVIGWSWAWVLAPIWAPFAFWFVLLVLIAVGVVVFGER